MVLSSALKITRFAYPVLKQKTTIETVAQGIVASKTMFGKIHGQSSRSLDPLHEPILPAFEGTRPGCPSEKFGSGDIPEGFIVINELVMSQHQQHRRERHSPFGTRDHRLLIQNIKISATFANFFHGQAIDYIAEEMKVDMGRFKRGMNMFCRQVQISFALLQNGWDRVEFVVNSNFKNSP